MSELVPGVRISASTWQQPVPDRVAPARAALLKDIAGTIVGLGSRRLLIAIDGRTAAGKTTFGHELATHIAERGRPVLRASLDDFKRPWRDRHLYDRESGNGYYRNAFDYDTVVDLLLAPASAGGTGWCALCAIDPLTQVDHSSERVQAPDDAVLIVDGVFAFRDEINDHWDLRLWLEVDAATSMRRGVARDEDDWAGSDAARLHRERYLASEELYLDEVDPQRRADLIIDNSDFDRPRLRDHTDL